MTLSHRLRFLWLTLAVVLLDRGTKAWFDAQTPDGWRHELIRNFIYLVHSRNPGIAFGLFSDSPSPWLRIMLVAGALVVIAALAWLLVSGHSGSAVTAAGIALILGGATGNLTDRILHGAVTDFFEVWLPFLHWRAFNPWPAFNVADSAIAIGAALVLLDLLFHPRHSTSELSSEKTG
jgi:signal peptidase II